MYVPVACDLYFLGQIIIFYVLYIFVIIFGLVFFHVAADTVIV